MGLEIEIKGIPELKRAFEVIKKQKMMFIFGYGTKEFNVKMIDDSGLTLIDNKFVPYEKFADEWGEIFYFLTKKGNQKLMINFDFTDEEKQQLNQKENPEHLAQQDFEDLTSSDEQELNEIRKIIQKQLYKEYDNYNYPLGADADSRAPWNQKNEDEPKYKDYSLDKITTDLDTFTVMLEFTNDEEKPISLDVMLDKIDAPEEMWDYFIESISKTKKPEGFWNKIDVLVKTYIKKVEL